MLKLKELIQLAEILKERLCDQSPNEQFILRCLDPIWPYIYPYGLVSYHDNHQGEPPEKTDRLKMEKISRAVTGSNKKWRSFKIGLCHTYRERHGLKRARARMVIRAGKGLPATIEELKELFVEFRQQSLHCIWAIEEARMELFDPAAAEERARLARSVRNDKNIPRFLRISHLLDYDRILEMLPAGVRDSLAFRYENPTPQTLAFDALQEYISLHEELWNNLVKDLLDSYKPTEH